MGNAKSSQVPPEKNNFSSPFIQRREQPAPEDSKKFVRAVGGARALHLMGGFGYDGSHDAAKWMDDDELADYLYSGRVNIKSLHFPPDFTQRLKEFDRFPFYYQLLYDMGRAESFVREKFALTRPDLRLKLDTPRAARARSKEEVEAVLSLAAEMPVEIPSFVDPRTYLLNSLKFYPWTLQKQIPWSALGARSLPGGSGNYLLAETLAYHEELFYQVRPVVFPWATPKRQERGILSRVSLSAGSTATAADNPVTAASRENYRGGTREESRKENYNNATAAERNTREKYNVRAAERTKENYKNSNKKQPPVSTETETETEPETGAICTANGCAIRPLPLPCTFKEEDFSAKGVLTQRGVWRCSFGKEDRAETPPFRNYETEEETDKKYPRGNGSFLQLELFHSPSLEELPIRENVYNREEMANLVPPLPMEKTGITDVYQFRSKFPYGSWKTDFPPDFLKELEATVSRQEKNLLGLLTFTGSLYEEINEALKKRKGRQEVVDMARGIAFLIESVPPMPGPLVLYRGVKGSSPVEWQREEKKDLLDSSSSSSSSSSSFGKTNLPQKKKMSKTISQLKIGDLYQEYGFASKSYWSDAALNFSQGGCCLLELHYPAGHKVLHMPQFSSHFITEYEYLTRPGEKFRLKDIKYIINPGLVQTRILVLEYVPPEREVSALEIVEEIKKDYKADLETLEEWKERKQLFQKASKGDAEAVKDFFFRAGVYFFPGWDPKSKKDMMFMEIE